VGFLVLVVLGAVLAPLLAPYGPNQINLAAAYQGLSSQHLLGTDDLGRDIFSRLLYGARLPLLGAGLIDGIATALGLAVATTAAWVGGWLDAVVSRTLDVLFAFPGLLLAILAVALFGPGFVAPVIALAIAYTPYMARLIRSVAIRERSKPYIDACSVQGWSGAWICVRHLLPNLLPFVVVQATVSFGYALIDLASLSFLGLGVQPPAADWGLMISEGEPGILAHHPAEALFPGLMIILTVTALVTFGERRGALRSRLR
jgi:peptide/nickel transport system permease protein